MLIKGVIFAMLTLILVSLFSALVLLFRRADRGSGVAKAFTWRIGLSLALFLLLMAGLYFGIIPPEGLSHAPGR
ncbi:MAG TPA: DUF2909 family protein [Burkholderiales bacterium]